MVHQAKLSNMAMTMVKQSTMKLKMPLVRRIASFHFSTTVKEASLTKVKPKKFLNDSSKAVEEFIEGLLLQYPNRLAKLQNHNVVLARAAMEIVDEGNRRVQLICGGGSGHEPAHAGYLGGGMLSAAVCGGMFASPPVSSVLAAIRATAAANNNKGTLVVIKNYTGDRLNFGLAAERAAQEGIPVRTVVVADDSALPREKGITGSRGVAGTVLVQKIAGGAAAAGLSLDETAAVAKGVCRRMGTLGVALSSVTLPGAESVNDRLKDDDKIEIGLGIHGEAGLRQSTLLTADETAREIITGIQGHGREQEDGSIVPMFQKGDEVAILVNNLGGTSNFEMSILAQSCVKLLESDEFGVQVQRVLVGSFMTAFDMHGASLTILNVTGQDEMIKYLDAPTAAPGWPSCVDVWNTAASATRPSLVHVPEIKEGGKTAELSKQPLQISGFDEIARKVIVAATAKLAESEPILTKYDLIVGDGDCGITLKRGALEVSERLEAGKIPTDHPVPLLGALGDAVTASMGGTSGVLLELMFRKMSSSLAGQTSPIGPAEMGLAFQAGVDAMSLYGGARVGSRTMLDALVPAAAALASSPQDLEAAAAKAREGADGTAKMTSASAGRSNYLSEDALSGTPDPGAEAVAIVLEAIASAAK